MAEPRVPGATYRLQLTVAFGFAAARALVPYLAALGITDLYASPVFTARRGSTHGYDVADPTRISDELGGEPEFLALTAALRERGMGLLLDIVPNHTAASVENPWWEDVLQNGPVSPYAGYFDVNWHPGAPGLQNKILLPILGAHYGRVLENGELRLTYGEHGFRIRYYEWRLPVTARSYGEILASRLPELLDALGPEHPAARRFAALVGELERLSVGTTAQFREARDALWTLYREEPAIGAFVDETVESWNGRAGDPRSFDRLDHLLSQQPYRLAYWRVASPEINYRRFFDISDLVSMRVEDERVFAATHEAVLRLAHAGEVTGLRIDHIDGLADPLGYLMRLQERLRPEGAGAGDAGNVSSSPGPGERSDGEGAARGFYVVVEKILTGEEELPTEWPVCGTTGYEFARAATDVLVDETADTALDAIYQGVTGKTLDFAEVAYRQKRRVMSDLFVGDVSALAQRLGRLAAHDRHARDLPLPELEEALVQVTASFPVYRTYIRDFTVSARDRAYIEQAVAAATARHPGDVPARDFLRRVLLLEAPGDLPEEQRAEWLRFTMRWQQFTGPIAAKGVEDTALYVYNRLLALNEVGSEPRPSARHRVPSAEYEVERPDSAASTRVPDAASDRAVARFHTWNRGRWAQWPHTLNGTSTHDTKRSEDVRARIVVLSELVAAWGERLERWREWNRHLQPVVERQPVPRGNAELLVYQTLLGAWPLSPDELPAFRERLRAYLGKASREAKEHTSWLRPNAEYEDAVTRFVDAILDERQDNRFLPDFLSFQGVIAYYGALNALSQVVLKLGAPGVPDFYQGTELWDLSLVDPDNRRPVDFERRAAWLAELDRRSRGDRSALARELLERWPDGRIKLYVTHQGLLFRRAHADVFADGEYLPLEVIGDRREHVCAFARRLAGRWALVVAPRLCARLTAAVTSSAECRAPSPELGTTSRAPDEGRQSNGAGDLPALRAPVGAALWGGTRLLLPAGAPGRWGNVLTGEVVEGGAAAGRDQPAALDLGSVLHQFPVGLLVGEPGPGSD